MEKNYITPQRKFLFPKILAFYKAVYFLASFDFFHIERKTEKSHLKHIKKYSRKKKIPNTGIEVNRTDKAKRRERTRLNTLLINGLKMGKQELSIDSTHNRSLVPQKRKKEK